MAQDQGVSKFRIMGVSTMAQSLGSSLWPRVRGSPPLPRARGSSLCPRVEGVHWVMKVFAVAL